MRGFKTLISPVDKPMSEVWESDRTLNMETETSMWNYTEDW